MTLEALPDYRDVTIVVGASVRKSPEVLSAHLASLDWQELPVRHRLYPIYIPDMQEEDPSFELLFRWVNSHGGELLRAIPSPLADFREGPDTHEWTPSAMARVGAHKNMILRRALELHADYVFICDSDLMLDKTTVASLIALDRPIATAVYWTYWHKSGMQSGQLHAAPQVWLRHPYGLDGHGMDEAEFRSRLISRNPTRVWGYGACTLIRPAVIRAGASYEYIPGVSLDGMMAGEDRHFCLRAERLHIEAWADPWPDVFHLYHQEDCARIPEMARRLGTSHPAGATLGDLISLRLRALEPVQFQNGLQLVSPQIVRGRLGTLALLPELEDAVCSLKRGERRIVRVHPPAHYPLPQYRNAIRLIEVTLLDTKPMSAPPILEQELYIAPHTGALVDQTNLSEEQHLSIGESVGA